MAERGGIAVHKASSEVEQEELAFEEAPLLTRSSRGGIGKATTRWADGLEGVLIGTGLGMAIALAECA